MFECADEVCYEKFIWEAGTLDLRSMDYIFLDEMHLASSELCTHINQTKTNPEMKPPPLWPFTWKGKVIKLKWNAEKKDPIKF